MTCTIEEMAELEFEPWTYVEGEWVPPSNSQYVDLMNPHLVIVRAAWALLYRSKDRLLDACDELGGDEMMNLGDRFEDALSYYKAMTTVLETAQARHWGVMASYALTQDEPA